ncbi:MAG: hypothetical protein FD172_3795 [Methylocystaceae bacterium]|nr:MAG: hypothetical protein FD172_3795 [Methylocystaceae bacterium]
MLLVHKIRRLSAKLRRAARVSVAAVSCASLAACMPIDRADRSQFIEQPAMTRTLSQAGDHRQGAGRQSELP